MTEIKILSGVSDCLDNDIELVETDHETPPPIPESFTETPETFETFTETSESFTPATKNEVATHFGVSRTSVNNWLAKCADILNSVGIAEPLIDPDGMVTPFGFRQLEDFRQYGADEYRNRLFACQTGRYPQTTTTAPIAQTSALVPFTQWDFDPNVIPTEIVEIAPRDTQALLQVSQLAETTEQLNMVLAATREQAAKVIQRDRLVRRANMIALARQHAAEDKAAYASVYQNELAKDGLGL